MTPYTPPLRFGIVNMDIYRGAYPTLRNFRFLRKLRLRTIISLTPEPPNADLLAFASLENIDVQHFQILRLAPLNNQLQGKIAKILSLIINSGNHPVYIHCLDGRRLTGLLVLLLRRLQCWSPQFSFTEFWRHQDSRGVTIIDLERSSRDIEKFLVEFNEEIIIPETIPSWLWDGDRVTIVPGLKLKHIPPIEPTKGDRHEDSNRKPSQPLSSSTKMQHHPQLSRLDSEIKWDNSRNNSRAAVEMSSMSIRSLLPLPSSNQTKDNAEQEQDLTHTRLSKGLEALSLHGMDIPLPVTISGKRDVKTREKSRR